MVINMDIHQLLVSVRDIEHLLLPQDRKTKYTIVFTSHDFKSTELIQITDFLIAPFFGVYKDYLCIFIEWFSQSR